MPEQEMIGSMTKEDFDRMIRESQEAVDHANAVVERYRRAEEEYRQARAEQEAIAGASRLSAPDGLSDAPDAAQDEEKAVVSRDDEQEPRSKSTLDQIRNMTFKQASLFVLALLGTIVVAALAQMNCF